MLKTSDIDLRALLDDLEEPPTHDDEVVDAIEIVESDDDFDGICTQHESCRII